MSKMDKTFYHILLKLYQEMPAAAIVSAAFGFEPDDVSLVTTSSIIEGV
jgi:hypothetical protein